MSLFANLRASTAFCWKKSTKLLPFGNSIRIRYYCDCFKDVRCKVIVIVGGKNSPTLDIAECLADGGAKAIILGTAPNEEFFYATEKLNRKYGEDKVIIEPCDMTKKSQVMQLFKLAMKQFNKVDIVVNSTDLDGQVDHTIHSNIRGTLLGTLAGFYYMGSNKNGNGGIIINVCSILGLEPFFGSPVYAGAKHFVIGFSRSMGSCYFQNLTNVKLFTVCVGITNANSVPKAESTLPGFETLNYEKLEHLGKLPAYNGDKLKSCLLNMLEDDENGSVWIVENKEFYKANIPFRNACRLPIE